MQYNQLKTKKSLTLLKHKHYPSKDNIRLTVDFNTRL